ncbi:MAG: RnfABCDGE type electron transport complex subunit D [Phycisphaerae bacterium]|nr:RnfABCDGE type electron transport complex subunit D [Phycisphaerae bacterium]
MTQANRAARYLHRESINRRVIWALTPCVLAAVYYFGWRSLAIVLWACVVGFVVEYLFTRQRNEPVSESIFVTAVIFALIMPPTVGWHVVGIGMAFAAAFGKGVFGGFGRNIFNPAMAGRCFVYICFPVALTAVWAAPAQGLWGALDKWTTASEPAAVTGATPMAYLKAGKLIMGDKDAQTDIPFDIPSEKNIVVQKTAFLKGLIFGRISGTMGVTSALVICIGGLYLFITKTANRSIMLSLILTYAILNQLLFWFGVKPVPGAWPAILGGGFLFGAFYMATDPVSAPKTKEARIFYGIIIGIFITVIRNFSIFNGGLMFAILIGNMFAPIMDYAVREYKKGKPAKEAVNA